MNKQDISLILEMVSHLRRDDILKVIVFADDLVNSEGTENDK